MALIIRLLGPVEIEVDGRPLKVDTRKAVALLAYLAATGRAEDRERLVDLLWPEYSGERGRAALRRTLSALKSALGGRWVEADRSRVALSVTGVEVDVDLLSRIETPHRHPEGQSCAECVDALRDLVALRRGDFMQGFVLRDSPGFEEWQLGQNERARRELSVIFDRLLDACVALGDDEEGLTIARERIALDPLNEPAYRTMMRIHARRGNRGGVVESFRALVASLERELGVEPLAETTDLYRALARGEMRTAPGTRPEPVEDRGDLRFVGRSREWDRLVTAYQASAGHMIGIEGEPGIGKSRLVAEFAEHVQILGARVVVTRSHEGEANVAYGVMTEALRELVTSRVFGRLSEASVEELARLLPEFDVPPAESPLASRFYEAVRSAFEEGLRGRRPGLIVFEDVHWSDDATLDVLAYIARRLAETGIFLVLTWRPEEVDDHGVLVRLFGDTPSVRLRLDRLGLKELERLAADSGLDDPGSSATRLLEETEGVPYFVGEYLKVIAAGGNWELPSSVRELLVHRIGSARGAAAQILDTAAVIDRAVDFDLVCRVSGRTDLEAADALDELSRTGLLRASTDAERARYEFSHEKLRTVTYEEMGPARRHVLHRRTAEALIESSSIAERDGPLASAIAHHFEMAGAKEPAAAYHRRAGMWAHRMFAHGRAVDHFRHALALGDVSAEIHEAIADVYVLQGDYAQAVVSYETAAALADRPEGIDRKLGALHLRRGDYVLAEAHLNDALERSNDDAVTADILVDLSLSARRRGADDDALRLAADAVERAAKLESSLIRARAENAAGMLASSRGDVDTARSHLLVAFDMATGADDLPAMIAALNNLAMVERRSGNLDEATELTRRALEACIRFGDRHREAALENNLADLFHEKAQPDLAMEHLKRAAGIFAEVGDDPKGPLPEVWKLIEW